MGPNAILQMIPVLDRLGGEGRRTQMLAAAGIFEVPDGSAMIPESDAARLHQVLRREEPEMAPTLAAYAGVATGRYILTHRIPKPVQTVLRALPAWLAAPMLARAITQHAWTFAGSGTFTAVDAWTFEIRENPLIAGEHSDHCLCHWHAAVFTTLYRALVHTACLCLEATCGAQGKGIPCRFEVRVERREGG
ncbi:MAG: bacteriochlorophyll 4-vinyl reductase [Pseudomonadota bacterium]